MVPVITRGEAMTGDTFSGAPGVDEIGRLTALVEAQASRLAALEVNSRSGKKPFARRVHWGRGLATAAAGAGVILAATASAAGAPQTAAGGRGRVLTRRCCQ